jgi:long-chain fatty acid transport protein
MSTQHHYPWIRGVWLKLKNRLILFLAIGLACWPGSSPGLGTRIPNQDAEAIGRGNAFAATANNPSAIYYNPAGITQLEGQNFQFGAHSIAVNSEVRTLSGSKFETEWEIQSVPQMYYTMEIPSKSLAVGLGVFAPFGLGLEWPKNTTFNTLAHEGRLMYVAINPVIAWKVLPNLSVAAGPTFNYSRVKLRTAIGLTAGDEFKYEGEGSDLGFSAGVLWQPHEQWSIGASYRSATTLNYRGKSGFRPYSPRQGTSIELDYPQFIIAGVSYRPTEQWNLEVGVDWTDWETVDTPVFKDTANGDIPFPLNWHSSFFYHAGASYRFKGPYYVSLGYFFSEDSTRDRYYTPIVPDTDLHVVSLGVGYKGPRWRWAIAAQVITGPTREVRGSQSNSLIGQTADGDYHFFNQAINFSVGYHF